MSDLHIEHSSNEGESEHTPHPSVGADTAKTPDAYLASILEGIRDGFISLDADWRCTYVNRSAEAMLGKSRAGLLDRVIWEEAFPLPETDFSAKARTARQTGQNLEYEAYSSALTRWFAIRFSPFADGLSIFLQDITEHKYLREELQGSRDQLEAILQNVADGIVVQDNTGRMVYANLAAARSIGYTSVEAMLQAPPLEYVERFEITDEEGHPLSPAVLPGRRAIQGEQHPELRVRAIDRQSGQVHWGVIKSTAIYDAEKKPVLVVNIIQDITRFKELERRKDDFIAMANHELKTPITSLKIFVGLLQKLLAAQGDEQIMHYLERMDVQLNKLTHLISDLLDVSYIQAGKLSLHVAPFDLNELIHETVETLQNTTSTHRLLIEGTLDGPLVGDRDRLGQVLTNLLTNAIKYSPRADKICVRVSPASDHVRISVQDFGIGIPPEHLPHIFNQFYRAGEQDQKRYPGLGIGLYITREIVQHHGGQIRVESERGVSTTFHVRLPLSQNTTSPGNS